MRIAYLSTFYPLRGGIAQFNAALYNELIAQGHEVKAFTFSRQYPEMLFPGKTQYVTQDDVADKIDSAELLDTINPFTYLSTAKAIREFQPDMLLMKYWMSFFGPSLGTVARRLDSNTKVVTVLDNVIPHEKRFFDDAFTNYFLKAHDGFVSMSQKVDNDLKSIIPSAKSQLLPHPLYDHFGAKLDQGEARKQLNIPQDKKVLLFFGFIRDYKGLDILIDSFAQLDSSYHLVIAGEVYGSFDKYHAQIDQHPLKEHISVFNDYIGDHEVPKFFSSADVCVLPYKSATQSGITSISYHFDLPLIATNVGGLKETIFHNETGLICEQPNAQDLTATIQEFFNAGNTQKFEEGIQKLKDEWSWKTFAKNLTSFVDTL